MNHFFILLATCLFLAGCSGSKGDKNTGTFDPNADDLASLSAQVCDSGQTLKLVDSTGSVEHLQPAIAFVSGDGDCALTESLRDEWFDGNRLIHFIVSVSGCVPNNSLWKLESQNFDGLDVNSLYINADGTDTVRVRGYKEIGATYARDHAGIRKLECQ